MIPNKETGIDSYQWMAAIGIKQGMESTGMRKAYIQIEDFQKNMINFHLNLEAI